jgi:tetratricopeptide (TPR) repeat protein
MSANSKKAHLHALRGDGALAFDCLRENKNIAAKYEVSENDSAYNIYYAYAFDAIKDYESAISITSRVLKEATDKRDNFFSQQVQKYLAELYLKNGDFKDAANSYQKHLKLAEDLRKESKALIQLEDNVTSEEKNKNHRIPAIVLSISTLCLVVLCALFWRKKSTFSQDSIDSPNLMIDLKKQHFVNVMKETKEGIRLLNRDKANLDKNINLLVNKINDNVSFQNLWEKIHIEFEQQYPSFKNNLKARYPEITSSELRHCMLLKLGLDSSEISKLLNMQVSSVTSAHYRLRKKMDLELIKDL